MSSFVWLIVLATCLVIEIITLGLTTIWFAAGAVVSLVLALAGVSEVIQMIVFIAVSLVMLYFTRPWAAKYLNANIQKTNLDSIIGETCVVIEDIKNQLNQGQVNLKGQIWTARSINDQMILKESIVQVVKIEGVKLFVHQQEE